MIETVSAGERPFRVVRAPLDCVYDGRIWIELRGYALRLKSQPTQEELTHDHSLPHSLRPDQSRGARHPLNKIVLSSLPSKVRPLSLPQFIIVTKIYFVNPYTAAFCGNVQPHCRHSYRANIRSAEPTAGLSFRSR